MPSDKSPHSSDKWFAPGPFSAIALLLLLLRFPAIFTGAEVFGFRDFPGFGLPLAEHLSWSLRQGELPLWNPFSYCGLPFAAQWNAMVFYPPSWLLALFPADVGLSLSCLLHLWLGAVGMHRLGWSMTGCRLAGCFAGLAFLFNGLLINSLMWPNNIAAFGLFPWLFVLVRRALRIGSNDFAFAGILAGLQLLCGAPEVTMLGWMVIGGVLFCERAEAGVAIGVQLVRLIGVVLIGIALASVQLLPFLEMFMNSQRWGGAADAGGSAGLMAFVRLGVPLIGTFATPAGPRFHVEQSWTHSVYGGLLPLLLFGFVMTGRVRQVGIGLVVLALLAGICALGGEAGLFSWLLGWLPMRFPVKLLAVHTLVFPLVVALGIAVLLNTSNSAPPEMRRLWPGGLLVVLLLLIAAIILIRGELPEEQRAIVWRSLGSRVCIAALSVFLLIRLIGAAERAGRLRGVVLIAGLMVLDLASHQSYLAPTVIRSEVNRPPALPVQAEGLDLPVSRVALSAKSRFHSNYGVASSVTEAWKAARNGLAANQNLFDQVPKTDGFFSLELAALGEVADLMYVGPNSLHPGILGLLSVSHALVHTNGFGWIRNPNAVSLLDCGVAPVFLDPESVPGVMSDPDYSPVGQVLLDRALESVVTARGVPGAVAQAVEYRPHSLKFESVAEAPALVSVSIPWYPCWQATVDGREVPVWPANHAFMMVQVPAGRSEIVLSYVDSWFEIGRAISLFTILMLLLGVLRNGFNRGSEETG